MSDIQYKVIKDFGEIEVDKKGWKKRLKLIQWGDNQPKYDIRPWSEDNTKFGKGITLDEDEIYALSLLIEELNN